jgi:hypothetical protein
MATPAPGLTVAELTRKSEELRESGGKFMPR